MPYSNIISRTDAQARIPEVISNDLLNQLVNNSAALALFRRATMSTNQTRMPVISALPTAYFVNGDTGLKQTTEVDWANKYLNAEELAAIVPIPEAVLDDTSYDVWGEIKPLLEQAIGRAVDAAVFFSVNKPGSWPTGIAAAAVAASNTYVRGTNAAAAGGIAEDINQVMGLVEGMGYAVNGFVSRTTYKKRLRSARDTTGQKLLDIGHQVQGAQIDVAGNPGNNTAVKVLDTIDGSPMVYAMPGQWPTGSGAAELFAGDWTQQIVAVRRDFTYKILDQAVIQDNTGAIIYNLAQQDMVAMRVIFRVAWATANTTNYEQPVDSLRYPAGVLVSP